MITYWQHDAVDQPWNWFNFDNSLFNNILDPTPGNVVCENVHYAIEIDVSDNTDIPDEKEIGLFNDSAIGGSLFRWVTDRPDYDGVTVVPTGEGITATSLKWGEGMITAQSDIGNPIRLININIAGGYGSLSGFSFSIDNVPVESGNFSGQQFFDILDDNGIYLLNRKVRFYIILDDVFYNVWSGIVSKQGHNETRFDVQCEDDFKNIHKTFPPQIANETLFPSILKKSIGKPIPVTFGQVNNARLLNIQTLRDPIGLSKTSDNWGNSIEEKPIAGVIGASIISDDDGNPLKSTITIMTGIKTVAVDQFKGKFLRVVFDGGTDQFFEITANAASVFHAPSAQNLVIINVNGLLPVGDMVFFDPTELFFEDSKKYSWVEIFDFQNIYLVSNNEIEDFPDPLTGQTAELTFFNKDIDEFVDVSEAGELESLTNIQLTGFPGIIAFTNSQANGGTYSKQVTFLPQRATAVGQFRGVGFSNVSNDFPANGESLVNLIDKNRVTKYTYKVNRPEASTAPPNHSRIQMRLQFPEDINLNAFDEFYFVADYDITVELASNADYDRGSHVIRPVSIIPAFGGFQKLPLFSNGSFGGAGTLSIRLIHPSHFGETGLPTALLQSISTELDLTEFYASTQEFDAYPSIDIEIFFGNDSTPGPGGEDLTIDVFEVAIAGVKKISVTDDNIFVKTRGELFSAAPTDNVQAIFRHFLETYDGIPASDIDLNNLTNRGAWVAGRQVITRKNSFTYLKELAQQTFTGIYPTRIGKRGFNTYREQAGTVIDFAENNGTIIKDSITRFELSPINEVFNEFDIKYDHNVANGRFDKSVFIKKVTETAFPTRYESTDPGNDADFTAWTDITITTNPDGTASAVITGTLPTATAGDSISLDDPTNFGSIEFGTVTEVDTTLTFTFKNLAGLGNGAVTTTGTIWVHGSSIPQWTTFTGGFTDYNRGNDLWTVCRNSYLQTLVVRELPPQFSECLWFIDESEFGADPGQNSTPHKYLELLVEWTTRQKEIVEFSIPLTAANVVLELLTFVTFKDVKFTANELRQGYITKIKPDPATDTIILELSLIPADIESVTDCLIIESGLQPDTITESGLQPDTITESGLC